MLRRLYHFKDEREQPARVVIKKRERKGRDADREGEAGESDSSEERKLSGRGSAVEARVQSVGVK